MTAFPDSIYNPRLKENRPSVTYDASKKTVLFVEDINGLDDEVVALEENLQDKRDRLVQIVVFDAATLPTTGTGKFFFVVPAGLNGYNIVSAHAAFHTADNDQDNEIEIYHVAKSHTIFTTGHKITIEVSEKTSYTATDQPVINTDYDDVATGNELRIDITTEPIGAQGLQIFLVFRKPIA